MNEEMQADQYIPATYRDVYRSRQAFRAAFRQYLADGRKSASARERLYSTLAPWLQRQIWRYRKVHDEGIQFLGEDLA